MRTLFVVLLIPGLLSCSKSRRNSESFPDYQTPDEDWITFEGILPSGNGNKVVATLELMPGSPGMDGYFKLTEMPVPGRPFADMVYTNSQGKYSVLLTAAGQRIVHITRRRLTGSLTIGKHFGPSDQIAEEIFLKGNNDQLVLVDKDIMPIDSGYSLFRRSALFTVEGYVTVYNDTSAEFFERNTRKSWPVAQLACYKEAVTKYRSLAKEKFEGIYVKALSYSVPQSDIAGETVESLVFKRILVMDSAAVKQSW
jgi:hypothetical protein